MTTQTASWSILLVGGDEDDYILIRQALEKIPGMTVTLYWYHEKIAPIHLLTSGLYDIVVIEYTDCFYDCFKMMNMAKRQGAQVKWVMLTDWDLPNLERDAYAMGVNGFLSKDMLNQERLAQLLHQALE